MQMDVVYRNLSHNMGTVDFWLNSCVLGDETKQFPQRLVTTAWHLADNPGGRVSKECRPCSLQQGQSAGSSCCIDTGLVNTSDSPPCHHST